MSIKDYLACRKCMEISRNNIDSRSCSNGKARYNVNLCCCDLTSLTGWCSGNFTYNIT